MLGPIRRKLRAAACTDCRGRSESRRRRRSKSMRLPTVARGAHRARSRSSPPSRSASARRRSRPQTPPPARPRKRCPPPRHNAPRLWRSPSPPPYGLSRLGVQGCRRWPSRSGTEKRRSRKRFEGDGDVAILRAPRGGCDRRRRCRAGRVPLGVSSALPHSGRVCAGCVRRRGVPARARRARRARTPA